MAKVFGLIVLVWITVIFVTSWVHALRTGAAPVIGPMFCVRREKRPVGYIVSMVALLALTLLMIAASIGATAAVLPRHSAPASPRAGYMEPASRLVGDRDDAGSSYFPSALTRITYRCAEFPKPVPLLSDIEIGWYSNHLSAAHEPSIPRTLQRGGPAQNAYRFTWLRSFDKPIIVRIDEKTDGRLQMTATRLAGMGGYEPKGIEARIERQLTPPEQRKFHLALAATKRLTIPAVACGRGYDGAQWIMEAADRGAYRYVNRWSPKSGAVRSLGLAMLGFTGWSLEPIS